MSLLPHLVADFVPSGVDRTVMEEEVHANVRTALREDLGSGDVSAALISATTTATADIITRDPGVVCGLAWVREVCQQVDEALGFEAHQTDGDRVAAGDKLITLSGRASSMLTAERTALNFLQLLSGTATATARCAALIQHTDATLLDTRKTIPGLRLAQKYAVRCGGGHNHRIGLFDQFLIKENHIAAAGGIQPAVSAARALHPALKVEVEVESLDELTEAIDAGADVAMVDNFSLIDTHKAVQLGRGRIALESSGGINMETIVDIAETGVDFISIGELTKNVNPLDLSMRMTT